MSDVKRALHRTLKLRFELGLFDPVEDQPYWHVPLDTVATHASQATNMLAALESMVLLQNGGSGGGTGSSTARPTDGATSAAAGSQHGGMMESDSMVLPLDRTKKIALIGPHANASQVFVGDYVGDVCPNGTFACVQVSLSQCATAIMYFQNRIRSTEKGRPPKHAPIHCPARSAP